MSILELWNWHENQTPRREKIHNKAKFQQYFRYVFREAHEQEADEDLDHSDSEDTTKVKRCVHKLSKSQKLDLRKSPLSCGHENG